MLKVAVFCCFGCLVEKKIESNLTTQKVRIKRLSTMTFIDSKKMRKEITRVLNDRQKSRGECFFYHHKQTDQIMWGNKEEMTTEMKMWKQLRKDGILQMLEKNCKTKVIDGQTYYILVLQQLKNGVQEPVGIDMLGVGYGFMVDGFIYHFKSKTNRDLVFNWVMGKSVVFE